jgi:hypothetical protein
MMTKTFDCVECGASAPYGRLSCPSCGALLASVTGGRRPAVRAAEVEAAAAPESAAPATSVAVSDDPAPRANPVKPTAARKRAPAPPPFLDAAQAPAPAPIQAATPASAPKPTPTTVSVELPAPGPAALAAPPTATPARTPTYAPTPAARARNAASAPAPAPVPAFVAPPPTPAPVAAAKAAPPPAAEPAAPIPSALGTAGRTPSYAPTPAARARTATPAPAPTPAVVAPAPTPETTPTPESIATAAAPAQTATARSQAARAEAERAAIVPLLEPSAIASLPPTPWAPIVEPPPMLTARPYQRHLAFELEPADSGPPPSAYRPPSQATVMAAATAAANEAARDYPPMDASGAGGGEATMAKATWWLNTIPDAARFVEIAGWFIVVGATMSLLGFLLPWSRVVIGASTIGGYFDGWGLASPTHLFVFVGLLAVLALAIRREPVPAWISSGILGLVFGGLLLGLAWPYLVGPLGADVGLTMTVLGGVSLLIGGVVALWATRHVAVDTLV